MRFSIQSNYVGSYLFQNFNGDNKVTEGGQKSDSELES